MEIKDITKNMDNNTKIVLLKKLAVELSDKTSFSDSIYIGSYNDNGLYLSINEPNIFYRYLGYKIIINDDDNGNVIIDDDGLDNLKFLVIRINKYNQKENDFFKKLKEIL